VWSSLVLGFGLGFLVGFELGPMSAWLIRTTLRSGYGAGAAIAAGVGVVDLCYAGIGVTGVATALRSDDLRTVAGLIGAIVIGYLGVTALLAARQPAPEVVQPDLLRPRLAFVLSLGATAINPATIGSWAAVFAGLGTQGRNLATLVVGVGLGSLSWLVILTGLISLIRHGLTRRGFQIADIACGVCMLALAVFVAYRAVAA
jgi:putative LysE/RhtB family amino acid efflux pump